jgi:predicted PurR-regulated permease PerM
MDFIIIISVAGVAMALFSIVVMAFYAILEDDHKKKEYRRLARRQIIKEMEREKQMTAKMQETINLHSDYK